MFVSLVTNHVFTELKWNTTTEQQDNTPLRRNDIDLDLTL